MSDCDLDVQATMTMKKVIDENEASDLCFRLVHLFITKSQMPQSKTHTAVNVMFTMIGSALIRATSFGIWIPLVCHSTFV
jgi:hypothetical protein